MENQDILIEIPDEQLPNLRDMYKQKQNWPNTLHVYYYIDNYIDWKNRNATKNKFYCPEGKWDDGTFIAIEEYFEFTVFAFTLEKNGDRLKNALLTTKRIPWEAKDVSIFFLVIHESVYSTVNNVIKEKGWNIQHEDNAKLWWISKENGKKYHYSIPEDIYIAPLKTSDVPIINEIWPHKSHVSHLYLTDLIELNGGFGIYDKKTNELSSWVMRNNYGGLAILQTKEKDKRKGYASLITKYFTKYWAEKGLDGFCFIMTHNISSQILFEKLGYKSEHGINWIMIDRNVS